MKKFDRASIRVGVILVFWSAIGIGRLAEFGVTTAGLNPAINPTITDMLGWVDFRFAIQAVVAYLAVIVGFSIVRRWSTAREAKRIHEVSIIGLQEMASFAANLGAGLFALGYLASGHWPLGLVGLAIALVAFVMLVVSEP